MGGTPSEPKNGLVVIFFVFVFWLVFEPEAYRRKLLRFVNHQLRNQIWQEHLRVRASSLCARVSVYLWVHTWLLHQQCLTEVKHSRPYVRSVQVTCINTATTHQQQQHRGCPMNRGVRVGAASITDEPKKTPAMIKPDLLPTTYYLPVSYTHLRAHET